MDFIEKVGLPLLLFLSASGVVSSTETRYDNYKLLSIRPDNEIHVKFLRLLEREIFLNIREVDFWEPARLASRPILVSISPSYWDKFHEYLETIKIPHNVVLEDLQSVLDQEKLRFLLNRLLEPSVDYTEFAYNQYHTYDEIVQWIFDTKANYPDLVEVIEVTKSYEGRPIYSLKLGGQKDTPYAAYILAGTHAREWVSPATALYFINQLLDNYGVEDQITAILDLADWYFVPVHNADGYAYSWEEDRLWRKTRRPNPDSICIGTDPNRNWPYEWGGEGASTDPCHEDYRGPEPLSEVEVAKVVEQLVNIGQSQELIFFLDIHSYSQLWLSPWSHTTDLPPEADYLEQEELSKGVVDAIESVYGTQYIYGPTATTIYVCSGTSVDYAFGSLGVTHAYTIELRPGADSTMGFLLPEDQIIPTATEAFEGFKAAAHYIGTHVIST